MDVAVKINKLEGLERAITVTVSKQDYKSVFNKHLLKFKSRAKFDGFRAGKVPEKIILSKYKGQIHTESVNDLVETYLQKALSENNLETASPPQLSIDNTPSFENDFIFTAKFEVLPEFNLTDLSSMIIEKLDVEIQEKDIDQVIKNIQKQHVKWEKTTGKAKTGNKIIIDYEGLIDGKEFEGSVQKDFTFVIDEITKGDVATVGLYQEFFKAVTGEVEGSKKNFTFNVPIEFADKDIAGRKANYSIFIKSVFIGIIPELNKEFYKKFGLKDCDDTKFRENILKHMEYELEEKINSHISASINHQLTEKNNFEIPKYMIQSQKQSMTSQYEGMMKKLDEDTKLELEKIAIKRAKLNLIYMKISNQEKIHVTEQEVYNYIAKKDPLQRDAVIEKAKKDAKYLNQLKNQVLEDVIIKFVQEKCKTEKVKKNFSEVIN